MKILALAATVTTLLAVSQFANAATYSCAVRVGGNSKLAIITIDTSKANSSATAQMPQSTSNVKYVEMTWSAKTSQVEFLLEDESREVMQKMAPFILSTQPMKGFSFDIEMTDSTLSTSITCALSK